MLFLVDASFAVNAFVCLHEERNIIGAREHVVRHFASWVRDLASSLADVGRINGSRRVALRPSTGAALSNGVATLPKNPICYY